MRVPGRGPLHVDHEGIQGDAYRALDAGDEVSFRRGTSEGGPVVRQVRVERSLPRE